MPDNKPLLSKTNRANFWLFAVQEFLHLVRIAEAGAVHETIVLASPGNRFYSAGDMGYRSLGGCCNGPLPHPKSTA